MWAYCDTAPAILSQNFAALYLCFVGFRRVGIFVNLFPHGMSNAPQWFVSASIVGQLLTNWNSRPEMEKPLKRCFS